MISFISSTVLPDRSSALRATSVMEVTACLNTSRPSIFIKCSPCSRVSAEAGCLLPPPGSMSRLDSRPSERSTLERMPARSVACTRAAPAPSPNSTHSERSFQSVMQLIFSAPMTSTLSALPVATAWRASSRA